MRLGELFYKYRSYTPVPFFIVGVVLVNPREDLMVFGAILMVFGELLRFISVGYLGESSRTRTIVEKKLITNGPYAFIRNPIYTGNMFLYMGASIYCGSWLPFLLYIVIFYFSFQYSLSAKYEESKLEELYGEPYLEYKESVPRFYPRLSSYPKKSNQKINITTAFVSEKSTFIAIITFILLVQLASYIKA